jgi:8-oxo-dGTP diphosphatase
VKPLIRAAGGIVSRGAGDRRDVLLVHRAHREDWTFPKGKRRPDETDEACARREVEEETGLRCVLGVELPATTYTTRSGRRKRVRYWAMRVIAGRAGPRNEVDDVRWVGLGAAAALLTYERDRTLLATFLRLTSIAVNEGSGRPRAPVSEGPNGKYPGRLRAREATATPFARR